MQKAQPEYILAILEKGERIAVTPSKVGQPGLAALWRKPVGITLGLSKDSFSKLEASAKSLVCIVLKDPAKTKFWLAYHSDCNGLDKGFTWVHFGEFVSQLNQTSHTEYEKSLLKEVYARVLFNAAYGL